jgi:hypothetical protein
MALKSVLESIDDLPDEIKAEYKATKIGDKDAFVLDVEGVDAHPAVAKMKTALDNLKKDKKKLFDDLSIATAKLGTVPEDFDPDEWVRLKTEAESDPDDPEKKKKLEQHIAGAKKILEDRIKAMDKKHAEDLAAKDKTIAERDGTIASLLVDDGLTKALVEVGVGKQYLNGAKALLRGSVKVLAEEGEAPRAVFTTDLGEEDIPTFIKSWSQSEEGKAYIPSPSGGGAGGSGKTAIASADNPFLAKNWSKTQQGQLQKTDKVKAERYAKEAGFKDLPIALKSMKPIQKEAAA